MAEFKEGPAVFAAGKIANAADLDGDDDLDVLTSSTTGTVGWFENLEGEGQFGPLRTISTDVRDDDVDPG